ncbi:hypothetical protein HDU98_008869 [Podochytrium sp. JEL0797]|nr:hypothetical protein HDU98_008869 [Podochytrium sp. JEL0797]
MLSAAKAEAEIALVLSAFAHKETEETWIRMDDQINKFVVVARDSSHLPMFAQLVRKIKAPICVALNSERTRFSRTGMLLCETLAESQQERFEVLADFILPALLRLCTRANKVIVTSANNSLKVIIDHAKVPSLVVLLAEHICTPSPSKTLRISSAECLNRILDANSGSRLEKYVESIEAAIRSGTVDSTPEVRGLMKESFELYKDLFPIRLDAFIASLPDMAAKYLKVNRSGGFVPSSSTIRKPPPRPRVPTGTSVTSVASSSGPSRQPIVRTATVTPDNYSVSSRQEDDDTRSLASETPSFGVEMDEAESGPKLRSKPLLELKGDAVGKTQRPATIPHHMGEGVSAARRLVVEKPKEAGLASVPLSEHIGGAKRVFRESKPSASVTATNMGPALSKAKAMRVPAASVAPAAEPVDHLDSTTPRPPVRTASAVPPAKDHKPVKRTTTTALPPPRPTSRASITKHEPLDVLSVTRRLKNSDWTIRLTALETITAHIQSASLESATPALVADVRGKAGKCVECLLVGLADNQSKCISAGLTGLVGILRSEFAGVEMMDAIVPRVAAILYHQPHKSKPAVVALAKEVQQAAVESFGVEACAAACVHAVHNPEFGKVVKVRGGCVGMLAEMSDGEWGGVVAAKPMNMKLYMTRLLSQAIDTDATIQKGLKTCLAGLHAVAPDAFWAAWGGAKPVEKKAVNALFLTSDIAFSGKELEAAKKTQPGGLSTTPLNQVPTTPQSQPTSTPHKPTTTTTAKHAFHRMVSSDQKERPARVKDYSVPATSPLRGFEDESDELTATPSASRLMQPWPVALLGGETVDEGGVEQVVTREYVSAVDVCDEMDVDDAMRHGEEEELQSHEGTGLDESSPMESDNEEHAAHDLETSSCGTGRESIDEEYIRPSATAAGTSDAHSMLERLNGSEFVSPLSPKRPSAAGVEGMRTPMPSFGGSRLPTISGGASTSKVHRTSGVGSFLARPAHLNMPNTTGKMAFSIGSACVGGVRGEVKSGGLAVVDVEPGVSAESVDAVKEVVILKEALGEGGEGIDGGVHEVVILKEAIVDGPTKILSFGETTVIPGDAGEVCGVDRAAVLEDVVVGGTLEDLWVFFQDERNLDAVEGRLGVVVDMVVGEARTVEVGVAVDILQYGVSVLQTLIEYFTVDSRALDILMAALLFESKAIGTNDRLEIEYDVTTCLSTFEQTFDAKKILTCSLHMLESTLPAPTLQMQQRCFHLATHALQEAQRIEGNGSDDVLFGAEDGAAEDDFWTRWVPVVVDGLDAKEAEVRRVAFEFCVAVCARKGGEVAEMVFEGVKVRRGVCGEVVVRQMVGRSLEV